MLGPDGQPLARKYFAENTGKDLDADDVVRGYDVGKEKYVIVTDEELERLAPEKTRDIDLKQFVPAESIPPTHFERGYFLVPAAGSQKAYKLLAETMDKSELAGIATFVMRGKEYLIAIFSDNGILRAETMRFADELRIATERDRADRRQPGRVERRRGRMGSIEVLAGTRVPVVAVQRLHAAGWSADRIIENYPGLTERDVVAALRTSVTG